jgi:hypothetical protein
MLLNCRTNFKSVHIGLKVESMFLTMETTNRIIKTRKNKHDIEMVGFIIPFQNHAIRFKYGHQLQKNQ